MKVKLKGKTRHGKNRVSQHGDLWKVGRIVDGELGKGFRSFIKCPRSLVVAGIY